MPCGTLAEVELVLKGLMYPADKQDLLKQAKKNDADDLTLETLENVNKQNFYSHQDVVDAVTETSKADK